MKYVYIEYDRVINIIPEWDSTFPDIPITERYSAEFLSRCIVVDESVEVESGYLYNHETGVFTQPVIE
jgi:hypothetical protein